MISMDKMQEMLCDLLDELPAEFFRELNGGVTLLPEAKQDSGPGEEELYILGEYCEDLLGRCILLYYGSFERLFGQSSPMQLRRELRTTVRHEFRHHVESLAGEIGLELEDALQMEQYAQEDAVRRAPNDAVARERGLSEGRRFRRRRPKH